MTDYREQGIETFTRMMGEDFVGRLLASAESGAFLSDTSGMALDFAFGAVWSRPGLLMKERSLIVIGILVATGKYAELKNHVRIGVRNGLTAKEIEEALIQCLPYCGFPAIASAQAPIIEVLRELNMLGDTTKTPQERGVL